MFDLINLYSHFSLTTVGAKQLNELTEEQDDKIVGVELSETPLENESEQTEHDPLKVIAKDEEGLEEHDFHRVKVSGEDSVTCSEKDRGLLKV